MALFKFTTADKMAAKILEAGFYPLEVVKIGDWIPSSSRKSVSCQFDFQICDGPFKGKELSIKFNTETNSNSILGTQQFMPHTEIIKLYEAATGKKLDDSGETEIDSAELLNKKVDGKISVDTQEGNLRNRIDLFVEYGKGSSGPQY